MEFSQGLLQPVHGNFIAECQKVNQSMLTSDLARSLEVIAMCRIPASMPRYHFPEAFDWYIMLRIPGMAKALNMASISWGV